LNRLKSLLLIRIAGVVLLGLAWDSMRADAQDLRVAAASDLQSVLPAIAQQFQQQTGVRVQLTFGSSGTLFSQIRNGAPFDVFFSADLAYPRQLDAAGLAAPGTVYEYAVGRIVVWVRNDSGLDVSRGLRLLADARVKRVAVANPDHAPYGRAAMEALEHEGLAATVRPKLVRGENISQAAQFVQSGNADAGILALSLALSPALREIGQYREIPADFHAPLVQGVIVLKASRQQDAARGLLTFLQRPDTKRLLQLSGFSAAATK
jgi:molybdate transport system substrate-binding protein